VFQFAENIKDSWILRVVIIYAVALWVLAKVGIWEVAWTIAMIVLFSSLIIALGFLCLRNFSSIEDRNFLLARLIWNIGPCFFLLLCGPVLLKILPGPAVARDIQFFLLIFLGIIWYQLSVPFVRSWMRDSPNPEKLLRIERKLSYRGTLSEIMDVEPYISSRIYYAFVAGLISLILIFAVAVLSEILDESIGMAGYIGSVLIAFASAVAMYPIHKRVSPHLKISDSTIPSSITLDLKLPVAKIWRGLYDWSKPIVRYWYLVPLAMILIFAMIFVYRVVVRFAWL
jgi:hypothetical protein